MRRPKASVTDQPGTLPARSVVVEVSSTLLRRRSIFVYKEPDTERGLETVTPGSNSEAVRAGRVEELEDRLYRLALHGETEDIQVRACVALLNRIAGKPAQPVINMTAAEGREWIDRANDRKE